MKAQVLKCCTKLIDQLKKLNSYHCRWTGGGAAVVHSTEHDVCTIH